MLKRTLAIREQALGKEHSATATSLNNLADLCQAQGRYAEAEKLYRRAPGDQRTDNGAGPPRPGHWPGELRRDPSQTEPG